MRVELARAQYLLGKALTLTGKAKEAASHYEQAAQVLQSLSKQDGASHILDRPDLKDMSTAKSS